MAGRTNHRVQSASALMALLLALAAIATARETLEGVATGGALMRRSLITSEASEECAAEIAVCNADFSCVECEDAYISQIDECGAFVDTCGELQEAACCALTDEDVQCEDDVAYTNVRECFLEALNPQCAGELDLSDCNWAMGRATAWGLPSTLVSATVGALLVAAFGSSVV